MTDKALTIGVIGLGAIGRVTLASMTAGDEFEVVSAWDPDKAACATLRAEHPQVEITENAQAVIDDPRIKAVYIASPPLSHGAYIRAAANAGMCIFSEKPLGIDIAESEELVALVAEKGIPNVINFNHGNATASCHVENALNSGAIGDVLGVDIFIHLVRLAAGFSGSRSVACRARAGRFYPRDDFALGVSDAALARERQYHQPPDTFSR